MPITQKAYYLSAVNVSQAGPGVSLEALLLATADALGGEAKLVYMNVIPGEGGAPPVAPFAIVAVADRPGGTDPGTGQPFEPVAGFYDAGMLGVSGFLAKTFTALQALVTNQYGAAVTELLQDQDVGSYGLG